MGNSPSGKEFPIVERELGPRLTPALEVILARSLYEYITVNLPVQRADDIYRLPTCLSLVEMCRAVVYPPLFPRHLPLPDPADCLGSDP